LNAIHQLTFTWFRTALVCTCLQSLGYSQDESWTQFRGPNGSGVAIESAPPESLSLDRIAWRLPVPNGKSSPVVYGDRLFLTAVETQQLVTMAIDTKAGTLLWKQEAPGPAIPTKHPAGSAAAPTPCVDSERVYVYFPDYGLITYDHQGAEQWRRPFPKPENMYGVSTSPILHGGRLILVLDDDANLEGSSLSRSQVIAVSVATGETVWQTARPFNRSVWSTPMIWKHALGEDLVVLGDGRAYGYDPDNGEEKWFVTGFAREPIAVPVAGAGHLFLSVAMQGGRGDADLDPTPFWNAVLQFDRDGDGRIGRDEISHYFTLPLRPELPIEHPGFGLPLSTQDSTRRDTQQRIFDWRDTDRDGFWTKEEFSAELKIGAGRPCLTAIRPGGAGDVTSSHSSWILRSGIPEIPSPIFFESRLFLIRDGGVLTCIQAANGEVLFRDRLAAAGQYEAAPVMAASNLYVISAAGVLTVLSIDGSPKVLQQLDLQAAVSATPAFDSTTLYVRTATEIMAFR
jgi:outer membrane protein assembly factor BamB